ncbi:hypothetical protein L228DRAFT_75370 [Xylona heveae TC161]|uniref:peptidylprolyl isomerase n=1 Tax=Xylona heveae (strain CBS 132557 / TC161) TaxID=1328760 RepID=A0A165ITQ5_XYLHT|nr:hypothetical protein L228DRAFT_75370 [Xylona heveae TC161]KZF25376.1 hypothetical protein L228DRAFT_75370 [Xylona heveae TC161]
MASVAIVRPRVFMDIQIGTEPAGRLVIELFVDKAPKTCENFRALCTSSNPPLSYRLSPFHRIIDEFMIQGGDITKGDGTGGQSIYSGEFEDENIGWREIDREGLICMANRGKNTNTSQFFITLVPCPHLNTKHTVFGQLVAGQQTLERMAKVSVDKNDRPYEDVLVASCGELERRTKGNIASAPAPSRASAQEDQMDTGTEKEELRRGRKRRRRTPSRSPSRSSPGSGSQTPPRRDRHRHHHSESHHNGHRQTHEQERGNQNSGSNSRSSSPSRTISKQDEDKTHESRRRSDDALDSTLRGRPRQRSSSALIQAETTDVSSTFVPSGRETSVPDQGSSRSPSKLSPIHARSLKLAQEGQKGAGDRTYNRSSKRDHHHRSSRAKEKLLHKHDSDRDRERRHERYRVRSARRRSSSPSRSRSPRSSSRSPHLRRRGSRSRGRHGRRRRHFDEHEFERERLDEELLHHEESLRERGEAAEGRYEGVIEREYDDHGGNEDEQMPDAESTGRPDERHNYNDARDYPRGPRDPQGGRSRYHDRWFGNNTTGRSGGSGNYARASDGGRLSGPAMTPAGSTSGEIKFKGRGSMKYRERRW